jgi:hypothetical protein
MKLIFFLILSFDIKLLAMNFVFFLLGCYESGLISKINSGLLKLSLFGHLFYVTKNFTQFKTLCIAPILYFQSLINMALDLP